MRHEKLEQKKIKQMNRILNIAILSVLSLLALVLFANAATGGTKQFGESCSDNADCLSSMICSNTTCACDSTLLYWNATNCYSACTDETCLNGGACANDGYCDCVSGFEGYYCEVVSTINNSTNSTDNSTPS